MLNSCIVNSKVGPLSSHSCDCSDALWAPWHQASKVCTHPSVASFTVFFPCSMKFPYCKWRPKAAETQQWGYEFVARYSFLRCQAGLDETQTKRQCKPIRYPLVANFASGVSHCMGIVDPFKHHLCPTLNFWNLNCKCPWALAGDNIVFMKHTTMHTIVYIRTLDIISMTTNIISLVPSLKRRWWKGDLQVWEWG